MKKLIFIFMISISIANAQVIKHNGFTSYYDAKLKEPDSVSWTLQKGCLNCQTHYPRTNKFTADPQVSGTNFNSDYAKSGYDQGHQQPAEDANCNQTTEMECFYFTNMVPQKPNLNRITWKALEVYTRKLSQTYTVNVTCGIKGTFGTIGRDKINIPAYCWKRLQYNGKTEYYIMPNQDTISRHGFGFYRAK